MGVKGRAFNASRFTCRFAEKLPVSGARVTILRWVVTDTIASFKMNSFSWGGIEALFSPALYICSVSPHSALGSHFSSSAPILLPRVTLPSGLILHRLNVNPNVEGT